MVLAFSVATAVSASPARVELPSPNEPGTTGTAVPLDPGRQLALRVYLAKRPGLAAAAAAVSEPGNPRYAHFLTPAQFNRRYGTTAAQFDSVSTWLAGQGMTITARTPHYIGVTATVAQVDAAFDTQVSEFVTVVIDPKLGPQTYREPGVVGGFSVPARLAGDIVSVTGISEIELRGGGAEQAATTPGRARTRTAADTDFRCSQYWGQYTRPIPAAYGHTTAPTELCGYTPNQIRQAYGLASSPYTGRGATIAIILNGHVPGTLADSNRFFANHGLPEFAPGQYVEDIGPNVARSCAELDEPAGDTLETAIDVQSAHLAAPGARIVYVGVDCAINPGGNLRTWLDGAMRVVDQHLADIVSGSFGMTDSALAPADMAPWEQILQQGALEGIGFNFSTGDEGGVGDVHNSHFPASSPWVTAVGGTSLAIGEDGSVVGDHMWGTRLASINEAGTGYDEAPPGEFTGGTGGGVSTVFAQPGYQEPVVPTSLATDNGTARAARVVPDISANAGNAWLIGATDMFGENEGYVELPGGGGTSGSAPLIAGMLASAMQAAGHPLGFANPALYRLNGSTALRDILPVDPADPPIALGRRSYDIMDPSKLTTFGLNDTLTAAVGFDNGTGLGAPTTSFVPVLGRR